MDGTDKGGCRWTPLIYALSQRQHEVAKLLIEKGANVNYGKSVSDRWTPLIFAAKNGSKEISELLIKKGADINAFEGPYKRTPLIHASMNGQRDVA